MGVQGGEQREEDGEAVWRRVACLRNLRSLH